MTRRIRCSRLALNEAPLPAAARLPLDCARLGRALDHARIALAAEAAGAARGLFDLTQEYIAGRVQFGRSIASFQAIKHRMAALFVALNTLDALIAGAAESADAGDPLAAAESRAAWAMARDLQADVAAESIQLHGGVGATWEYAPHLFFKRARAQLALPDAPCNSHARHRSRVAGRRSGCHSAARKTPPSACRSVTGWPRI